MLKFISTVKVANENLKRVDVFKYFNLYKFAKQRL